MFRTFSLIVLTSLAAFAQTAAQPQPAAVPMEERTFYLKNAGTAQNLQEIGTGIRMLTEVRDMSADNDQMALKVKGTAEQLGLAEWLVQRLDRPVSEQANDASEYKGLTSVEPQKGRVDETARVFYINNAATVQDFQEIANAIRTVTETRRLFTYNAPKAMMVRGTAEQMGMIEFLVGELNQPVNQPRSGGSHEYRVNDGDVTRVFYLANEKNVQDFQQVASGVRTAAEIRRLFTYNSGRAIIMRSTSEPRVHLEAADQVAMTAWLVQQLDQPAAQRATSEEYRVPGSNDDLVRVFHVTNPATVQQFKQSGQSGGGKILTFDAARAVLLRGTASQLAVATQLMQQIDQ